MLQPASSLWQRPRVVTPSLLRRLAAALVVGLPALSACGGDGTGPLDGQPEVSAVVVTAPEDTLVAVSKTVPLAATATNSLGIPVSNVSFVWRSLNETVATVSNAGIVRGVVPGPVTITATAGGRSGSIELRVVAADLLAIDDVIDDPLINAVLLQLPENLSAQLSEALTEVSLRVSEGNISEIREAIESTLALLGEPADANETILFVVVELTLDNLRRLLDA